MTRRFAGWPERALDVLLRLDGEPPNAVREEQRKDRERLVRQPMVALLNDVADNSPACGDFSVWSYGKDPWWWQHQGATIRFARKVEVGLCYDLDGLQVKGAWHYSDPGQVALFRAAVAADDSGGDLAGVIGALRDREYEISGDVMRRMPRGYRPEHARADLLRHRSVVAARTLDRDGWLRTAQALDWVMDTIEDLEPMLTWLAEHVTVRDDDSGGLVG